MLLDSYKSDWGLTRVQILPFESNDGYLPDFERATGPAILRCAGHHIIASINGELQTGELSLSAYHSLRKPLTRLEVSSNADLGSPPSLSIDCEIESAYLNSPRLVKNDDRVDRHIYLHSICETGKPPIVELGIWTSGKDELSTALEAQADGWTIVPFNFSNQFDRCVLLVYKTRG